MIVLICKSRIFQLSAKFNIDQTNSDKFSPLPVITFLQISMSVPAILVKMGEHVQIISTAFIVPVPNTYMGLCVNTVKFLLNFFYSSAISFEHVISLSLLSLLINCWSLWVNFSKKKYTFTLFLRFPLYIMKHVLQSECSRSIAKNLLRV